MARKRISFKVAPGVRVSASRRGVRTSIGNNSARVSFGSGPTYTSAKVAGIRVSQRGSSGSRRVPRSPSRVPQSRSAGPSQASMAQRERTRKAEVLETQIEELAATERSLTSLHHESFEPTTRLSVPQPVATNVKELSRQWQTEAVKTISVFKRYARKAARSEADHAARGEAAQIDARNWQKYREAQAEADAAWDRLQAHDPGTVVQTLDAAFGDNASEARCVDAGIEDDRWYATVVIVVGSVAVVPERVPSRTPAGKPTTKKRTKTDRNALYVKALGSTVLATVKEAFAVAPSLNEVRVVVLRRDPEAATPPSYLSAIYTAEFDRVRTQAIPWTRVDPAEVLLAADDAQLQRKGATREVAPIVIDDEALADLVDVFAQATSNSSLARGDAEPLVVRAFRGS